MTRCRPLAPCRPLTPWRRRLLGFGASLAVAVAVVVGGATGAAWAHAGLVASTPEAATGVAQAPGAVVMRFSEPLNLTSA